MKNFIKNQDNYKYGQLCEFIVVIKMTLLGYKILAKRYKTQYGEIDIIAKKKNVIVFIEVKGRRFDIVDYDYIVLKKQWEKILKTSDYFIQSNPEFKNYTKRFDLCFFEQNKILPTHIKNITVCM
jgi:putative endonuclease